MQRLLELPNVSFQTKAHSLALSVFSSMDTEIARFKRNGLYFVSLNASGIAMLSIGGGQQVSLSD